MWRDAIILIVAITLIAADDLSLGAAEKFDTKTASFALAYKGETSSYRDTSVFVLPSTTLTIDAVGGPAGDYDLVTQDGVVVRRGSRAWRWTAPAMPGAYELEVQGPGEKKDTITLHAFVMVPASRVQNGMLNGYRIGAYPSKPLKNNPMYLPPPGFIEVTKENRDTTISPHFVLKQFLCKEDTSDQFPKYVVLQERLLLKLEAILERVNQLGFKTETLHVMSAYRTPYYNRAIGDVEYSMHQWGSAADIFVDPADKGQMEDLDRNRRVDIADAKYLYDRIEEMLDLKPYQRFQGGMGYYPATRAHPPFVHVDVRGTKARWKG
jgi:hypothetical protein